MSTLYLHIGMPKSGTSAIQFFMKNNNKLLKKKGYIYPDFGFRFPGIGPNRNAYFMTHKYVMPQGERDFQKEKELQDKGFAMLLKCLDKYPNVVLSDEHIWNGYADFPDFWKNIAKRITEARHELKVIMYLRRQDTFIQSYWAQQVKEVRQYSFDEYLKKKRYRKRNLNYDVVLDHIAAAVGMENIIVRVYEKGQYYGSDKPTLIADFLHSIGLELTDAYLSKEARINMSLDGSCTEIKRILNQMPEYRKKGSDIVPVMLNMLAREDGTLQQSRAGIYKNGKRQAIMDEFTQGNQSVAKRYLHREDGRLFYEEVDSSKDDLEEYSKEELVLACGKIMLEMERENASLRHVLKKWLRCKLKK